MYRKTGEQSIKSSPVIKIMRALVVLALSIVLFAGAASAEAGMRKELTTSKTGLPTEWKFNVIAEPFAWGKDVTRLIINAGQSFNAADVNAADFSVTGRHYSEQAMRDDSNGSRKVIDAYPVDEEGNRVEDSTYIVVELEYGKDVKAAHLGSASYASYYTPLTPYYTVKWSKVDGLEQEGVADLVCDEFELKRHVDDSIADSTYNFVDYAFYSPKNVSGKAPLIIFFHGMGEGGARDLNNKGVQMYAYQEEYFAEPEVQEIMGGAAYVLLPQAPDQWPTDGFTNESKYLEVVKSLVDTIIAQNPDIDTDRIYIGGLSMGGYMCCRMIINYPEMFAAAFPCSQAYAITEEDAEKLKDLPIWVSCSEVDGTCRMDPYTYSSYLKIKDGGNKKSVCCVMESCQQDPRCTFRFYTTDSDDPTVYEIACDPANEKRGDLTWNNDTYGGHEAGWILLFNNQEYYMDGDQKISVMEWVASQSLVEEVKLDTSKAKLNFAVGEEFNSDGLEVNVVKRDGSTGPASSYSVYHPDTTQAGTQKVKVTCSGKTVYYDITVGGSLAKPTTAPSATNAPATTQVIIPSAAPTQTVVTTSKKAVKVGKVKSISVKKKGAGKVYVSWKKASGAKKYELYYSTDKKFKKGVKKLTIKQTSITFKILKYGTNYYFKVRGFSGKTYGGYSPVKKFKTKK